MGSARAPCSGGCLKLILVFNPAWHLADPKRGKRQLKFRRLLVMPAPADNPLRSAHRLKHTAAIEDAVNASKSRRSEAKVRRSLIVRVCCVLIIVCRNHPASMTWIDHTSQLMQNKTGYCWIDHRSYLGFRHPCRRWTQCYRQIC